VKQIHKDPDLLASSRSRIIVLDSEHIQGILFASLNSTKQYKNTIDHWSVIFKQDIVLYAKFNGMGNFLIMLQKQRRIWIPIQNYLKSQTQVQKK
jgi:hypothetical protein